MLFVIAMRDIREGEELLAEYGEAASLSLTRLLSDALSVFSCAHAYLLCLLQEVNNDVDSLIVSFLVF